MAGMVENLYELLEQQKECYEALLVLSEQKKDCLVNKETELVGKITTREESFIGRVMYLEKQTKKLIKDLGLVLGVPKKNPTISEVMERCSEEEQKRISMLKNEILLHVENIKKVNEINRAIITHSLDLIDFSVTAIRSQRQAPPIGYGEMGDIAEGASARMFDVKR